MSAKQTARSADYEAEVIPGLEAFAIDELRQMLPESLSQIRQTRPGFVRFRHTGDAAPLRTLRSVIAIYRIHRFAIPRPKALLGHEHFTRLLGILRATARGFSSPPRSMGIAAAGSQSGVILRLRQETSRVLDLPLADDGKGELFLRLVRQADGAGWEALVRSTASPMSKRDYRRINVPGALNATVAYAMTRFARQTDCQIVLNLCSGSSTILIEHKMAKPGDRLIAIDNCPNMLKIGRQNAGHTRQGEGMTHLLADARRTPLPAGSVDLIYADLPFGHHIGSHKMNRELYPALLREAGRLAKPNATLVLLTHEIRLLTRSLTASDWRIHSETAINLRGLHPRLFVLQKNSARI